MSARVECSRMLLYRAAWMKDQGMDITVEAVQVHGGYGFVKEYHVE